MTALKAVTASTPVAQVAEDHVHKAVKQEKERAQAAMEAIAAKVAAHVAKFDVRVKKLEAEVQEASEAPSADPYRTPKEILKEIQDDQKARAEKAQASWDALQQKFAAIQQKVKDEQQKVERLRQEVTRLKKEASDDPDPLLSVIKLLLNQHKA